MEGVVVKNDKLDYSGKLVTQEFLDGIENVGHWMNKAKQKFNTLIVK